MKGLKIILGITYPILIILLLLSNCNRDKAGEGQENTEEDARTVKEEQVDTDTAQVDTAQAVREARNTGQTGNLKVTLLWDFYGDIDLHVMQPNGIVINFSNPQDAATGGELWMLITAREEKGQRKIFFGPIHQGEPIRWLCTILIIKTIVYQRRVYARW